MEGSVGAEQSRAEEASLELDQRVMITPADFDTPRPRVLTQHISPIFCSLAIFFSSFPVLFLFFHLQLWVVSTVHTYQLPSCVVTFIGGCQGLLFYVCFFFFPPPVSVYLVTLPLALSGCCRSHSPFPGTYSETRL